METKVRARAYRRPERRASYDVFYGKKQRMLEQPAVDTQKVNKEFKEKTNVKLNNTYIVAIAKDEDDYIDEWLNYHFSLGVSKVILLCHNWKYDFSKYGSRVETVMYDESGDPPQLLFYNAILKKLKDSNSCKYAAFIDVDEFITFDRKFFGKTITEIIDDYNDRLNFDVLLLPWKMFGNNGLETVSNDYSVIDRFTRCAKDFGDCGRNNLCKMIVNVNNSVVLDSIHGVTTCKQFFVTGKVTTGINVLNEQMFSDNEIYFYISHYYTKTKEEYKKRAKQLHTFAIIGNDFEKQWRDRSNPVWNRNEIENTLVKDIRNYYKNENKQYVNLCHWWFKRRDDNEFSDAERLNLYFVKRRASILNRIDLYVAMDEDNESHKEKIKNELSKYQNIKIYFVKNESGQEYSTWKHLLTDYEGCYVLYSHFKGVSHENDTYKDDVLYWTWMLNDYCSGIPFFSTKCFDGLWTASEHMFNGHYQGTFYWCDIDKLKSNVNLSELKFKANTLTHKKDAYICEEFPSLFNSDLRKYEFETNCKTVCSYRIYSDKRFPSFLEKYHYVRDIIYEHN